MTEQSLPVRLAAQGLAGVDQVLPSRCLDAQEWQALLDDVDRQRLWGLLGMAVSSGALPTTDKQASQAEGRYRQAMRTALELEAMAVNVADRFGVAGIPVRLLKGLAVAHLDEVDPVLRCFNDVDLLVRGEHLSEAVRLLREDGYERDLPERRPGYDRRFGKEITMKGRRGREVDLHRTLVAGGLGLAIAVDDLWGDGAEVVLAGRKLSALDADLRLLHACYAAMLGDPSPRVVLQRDIALLLTGEQIDMGRVVATARRWRGESVLAAAVVLAADTFRAQGWPLVGWARSHQPTSRSRRLLRSYRSQGGSNTRVLLSGLVAPVPMASRVAYLRALLFPADDYQEARRRVGRPAERRTGLRELFRRSE